jgi:hypothetical protein
MSDLGLIQSTDDLIEQLAGGVRPVARLRAPFQRFMIWLAMACMIAGWSIYAHGFRTDFEMLWGTVRFQLEFWTSIGTGLLAAFAAFQLAMPDRPGQWGLLPVPMLVLWLLTLGGGCYADFIRLGPDGLRFGTSFHCLIYILQTSFLMALPMVFMLRHAGRIRPGPVILCAGLSVATISSAVLTLFHDLDTAIMILIWHGGALLAFCAIGYAVRGPAFFLSEKLGSSALK